MRPAAPRRASGLRAAAAVATLLSGAAGCGFAAESAQPAAASARPAAKDSCSQVGWEPHPELGLEQTSRELVGFSPTLLGVESRWAGPGITVQTVAGGYVDDLTEPFDDLTVTGHLQLAGGIEAEVLRGSLQETPVLAVLWRDPSQDVPCDVHALLAVGAEGAREDQVLGGLSR